MTSTCQQWQMCKVYLDDACVESVVKYLQCFRVTPMAGEEPVQVFNAWRIERFVLLALPEIGYRRVDIADP
jgi:hypothetical protein